MCCAGRLHVSLLGFRAMIWIVLAWGPHNGFSTQKFYSSQFKQNLHDYCHFMLGYKNYNMNAVAIRTFELPYSGKISRAKILEVDLPQNISQIKFRGSTRLSLHLCTTIGFLRINFQGSCEIHENSKIYCPRKIPAIQYK